MKTEEIDYALAKQVPDMHQGFTIATSYGDISVPEGDMANYIARWVTRCLEGEKFRRARAAEKAQAKA